MRKIIFITVFFVILMCCCKAKRNMATDTSRNLQRLIEVETHRLDSLFISNERSYRLQIEFYPQCSILQEKEDRIPLHRIKTIDIFGNEHSNSTGSVSADSSVTIGERTEDFKSSKTQTETRQDNGTVFIVAIVAATVLLVYLLIKKVLK